MQRFASHLQDVMGTQFVGLRFIPTSVDYKYRIFFKVTASWYPATFDAVELCDAYGELDVFHMCRHVVRCPRTRFFFQTADEDLFCQMFWSIVTGASEEGDWCQRVFK